MIDDIQLLNRFAKEGDEDAFLQLVIRHLDLVYSSALRQVNGDAHLAQDVTQTVFADLARKAHSFQRSVVLSGWLYDAARFAAIKAVRGERRRQAREQEALAMHDPTPESAPDWEQLRPVLDTAMGELSPTDRNAVLLRFFEHKDFRMIGTVLGLSEDAAQKRVARSLDKLRTSLIRRGITLTGSALAAAIGAGAIHSAPAGLAVCVAAAATTGPAAMTGFTTYILQAMGTIKIKILATTVVSVVVATPLVMQHRANKSLRAENATLRAQTNQLAGMTELQGENQRLAEQLKIEAQRSQASRIELVRLRAQVTALRQAEQVSDGLRGERDSVAKRLSAEPRIKQSEVRVKDISFKGNSIFAETELAEIIVSKVGEPVSQEKIDEDVLQIQKLYRDAGYGNIRVIAAEETDKGAGQSSVKFVVEEPLPK